jgi:hypothetical protein
MFPSSLDFPTPEENNRKEAKGKVEIDGRRNM